MISYCAASQWHFYQEEGKGGTESVADKRGRYGVTTGQRVDQHQHQHGSCSPGRVGKGAVSQDGGEIRSSWAPSEI